MEILRFPELTSTNTYAKEHLAELCDRTVIVAERQTAGRGQQGRTWESSNSENIYLSIVLKPPLNPSHPLVTGLSVIVGEAIAQYVRQFIPHESVLVKLPNDVLVNGKKLCGILIETVVQGELLKGLIVGIGFNIALTAAQRAAIDQPVTALSDFCVCHKNQLLAGLLGVLFDNDGVLDFQTK